MCKNVLMVLVGQLLGGNKEKKEGSRTSSFQGLSPTPGRVPTGNRDYPPSQGRLDTWWGPKGMYVY